MRINTNVASLNSLRILNQTTQTANKLIGQLSSGLRINTASDDAAGLAIANKLQNNARGMQQAQRNIDQATSMLQIADGATQTISGILDRMKELAAQGASSNIGGQGQKLQDEWDSLSSELSRIVDGTDYQGTKVLTDLGTGLSVDASALNADGVASVSVSSPASAQVYTFVNGPGDGDKVTLSAADGTSQTINVTSNGAQTLQFSAMGVTVQTNSNFVRSNGTDTAGTIDGDPFIPTSSGAAASFLVGSTGDYTGNDKISIDIGSLSSTYDALASASLTTMGGATSALSTIDTAVDNTTTFIGKLGAAESRLGYAAQNLASTLQNTQAAESTIRDADMAQSMSDFTKTQILQQAGTAMLAQANSAPQLVLKLLA